MDTYDSHRSTVPARLAGQRPLAPASIRTPGGLPEAASASPLSLRIAVRGARRYWWLVLMLWTVGSAGIGAVVYLKVRPSYRAFSYLRVDPSATDLYGLKTAGDQIDPFLLTQVQLITSPNVLTTAGTQPRAAALPRIQAAGDVVLELRKVMSVSVVTGTYLIEVAMSSPSPTEAATLVNAVVEAFMASNIEWSNAMTKTQFTNLETYLGELRDQSDVHELRWKELVARNNNDSQVFVREKAADGSEKADGPSASRTQITLESYRKVEKELFDVDLEVVTAEGLVKWLRASTRDAEANPSGGADEARLKRQIESRFQQDPEVIQLTAKWKDAENQVLEARRRSRQPGDPAEQAALRKVADAQSRYKQLWAAREPHYREQVETAGAQADPGRELREAEFKLAALKIKQAALKERFGKLVHESSAQASDEVEIALVRSRIDGLKSMQETVHKRLEQLRFEARGEARIRPVNAAVPPGRPITDNRLKYLAMTPVGVLGAVLGLIVLLEIRSARVGDPDLLSSRMRQEVFSIAPLPSIRPGDDGGEKAEQCLARFVQSLDHLRVALCEGGEPGEGRCVMITSATGGEGKTTLSAHLAARCANAGTSTLLIDADMRRASLGRLLDVPAGPGLVDVLAGETDFDQATITVQAGGFHFLSAGTPGRDPSRVLRSSRLSELLGQLRQRYDLVIIDTPPVLPVADALIMGRWADGAVMAARFDASRLPLVERANRQLAAAGIPVLGVVVNGVRSHDSSYGNYAYSYTYPGRGERADEAPAV